MRGAVTLAAVAAVLLVGCAKSAPPLPAAITSESPSVSASATTPSPTPSQDLSPSPSVSTASPSSAISPSVPAKASVTLKLPAKFGAYEATTATGTGEQQVSYANPADPKDTLNIVVSALADAKTIASVYTQPVLHGPAVCGTVTLNSSVVASCALPLDKGSIVVTGSGAQSIDVIAAASAALWAEV